MDELKPCPFCGSTSARLEEFGEDWGPTCTEDGCWCCLGLYATEEEAVAAWNRRVGEEGEDDA